MKTEKWADKMEKMVCASKILAAQNCDDAAWFTTDGKIAYRAPGCRIMSASRDGWRPCDFSALERAAVNGGKLVTDIVRGTASGKAFCAMKCGDVTAYVLESFVKKFPKNALWYVTAWNQPVLACLEDGNRLETIGFVMPALVQNFKEREA